MFDAIPKVYKPLLKDILVTRNDKLNIAIVGNIESGKSVVERVLYERFREHVEILKNFRVLDDGPAFVDCTNALVNTLNKDLKVQNKRVRLCKFFLDSI